MPNKNRNNTSGNNVPPAISNSVLVFSTVTKTNSLSGVQLDNDNNKVGFLSKRRYLLNSAAVIRHFTVPIFSNACLRCFSSLPSSIFTCFRLYFNWSFLFLCVQYESKSTYRFLLAPPRCPWKASNKRTHLQFCSELRQIDTVCKDNCAPIKGLHWLHFIINI